MIVPDVASAPKELIQPRADQSRPANAESELQRTCLAVLRSDWTTLAVVALEAGAPARQVASALGETAQAYRLRPVRMLNGSGLAAVQIPALLDELASARGNGSRTVITVEDPLSRPTSVPLLLAADAALLLVRLGTSELRAAEAAADLIGRERVLGCVVVR